MDTIREPNRTESDSIGSVQVPRYAYWGANTQRSMENFTILSQRMPMSILYALVMVKNCAAKANAKLKELDQDLADSIVSATQRVLNGEFDDQFPLSVWQTGSGTQSNMNVNEVIANIANENLGYALGSKSPVHPNDHVNKSQSSNDTFPTAMHVAIYIHATQKLLPALRKLDDILLKHSEEWQDIIKIGRTHMQDATPITLGQEFSAYRYQVKRGINNINKSLDDILYLAQGGTAVGTGINCPKGFIEAFIEEMRKLTGYDFKSADNKFEALSCHDSLVHFSGTLNTLATILIKIANDIRYLASGPRCGIGEILMPANEPGSSIMPGKINPTQCEAMLMICAQVMGNHFAVSIGGANGHLELNVYKPLIGYNILSSIDILYKSINSFVDKCLAGIEPNQRRIKYLLDQSLMLVTALNPHIGYDKAAQIAKIAHSQSLSLKEAALQLGFLTEDEFDRYVVLQNMI